MLPGGGAALPPFSAYALEKKIAADPSRFGKGAIEGVAAPEAANNAGAQTSFVPMLTLGLPTNPLMALMIGALMIQGIQPGPQVMTKQPELFWGVIASMWIGNLMLIIINLPLIGIWVSLLRVPYDLLFPAIVVFCCIGAYSINSSLFDLWLMLGFGLLGYFFLKIGVEPAPFVLGFVLGPMLEENFRRAMLIASGDIMVFLERPISAVLLACSAAAARGPAGSRDPPQARGLAGLTLPPRSGAPPATGDHLSPRCHDPEQMPLLRLHQSSWWRLRMTSTVRGTLRISTIAAAALVALLGVSVDPGASQAETQISVYGGANTNLSSRGTLVSGATVDSRDFDWEGKSFQMPPYWGAMITHWWNRGAGWGLGVRLHAQQGLCGRRFRNRSRLSHLEFTDGNNLLMLNLMYRFNPVLDGKLTPFVGIGAGIAIPHVEVDLKNGAPNTREYQFAGGAGQVLAGVEYNLNESWSVFAAGKLSYSHLATDLEGGGHFKTHLWSPQIAIGLSYRFGN